MAEIHQFRVKELREKWMRRNLRLPKTKVPKPHMIVDRVRGYVSTDRELRVKTLREND
jgi:hypothetical protein